MDCCGCDGDCASIESAGIATAALPWAGHGSRSFPGITAGNVVVVVVEEGTVVVVDEAIVVVVVVVELAITGVTRTNAATSALVATATTVPRRKNGRGDNFTRSLYFASLVDWVTAL
jgi:hypothetical protein